MLRTALRHDEIRLCATCHCPVEPAGRSWLHTLTGMFSCMSSYLDQESRRDYPVPESLWGLNFAHPGSAIVPRLSRSQIAGVLYLNERRSVYTEPDTCDCGDDCDGGDGHVTIYACEDCEERCPGRED